MAAGMTGVGAEGRNQVEGAETCGLWHEVPMYSGMKAILVSASVTYPTAHLRRRAPIRSPIAFLCQLALQPTATRCLAIPSLSVLLALRLHGSQACRPEWG